VQVPERFPYLRWFQAADDAGVELHIRYDNTWDRLDPIEDCALPPLLAWTTDLRDSALADYNARWSSYLEEDQYYEMSWPPEPQLITEGDFDWDDNGEQTLFDRPELHLARWEWFVTVTTFERRTYGQDQAENVEVAQEQEHVFTTYQSPRELIFGPALQTGRRELLDKLIGSG
jgi:hypothetical protein